ncbi:hypothetical protein EKO04_004192 [Ascochyta lentis]|uniref:F-box domain-containing protein n=1 Tax=Ascochyta lentis TaxID=205686 RepID=A0A8H7J6L7_9PLEO|nr:hypothetical protein EKO04_004192 [Ascochyta lentis]
MTYTRTHPQQVRALGEHRKHSGVANNLVQKCHRQGPQGFLGLPAEIRNQIYKNLEQLAAEEPSNLDHFVKNTEDPDKITSDPRHYLLSLSKTCNQLNHEVGPLHERFRIYTPVRIRLEKAPAYHALLSGEGDQKLKSSELFGQWDDFVIDVDYIQKEAEVNLLPFLLWIHQSPNALKLLGHLADKSSTLEEQHDTYKILQASIKSGMIGDRWNPWNWFMFIDVFGVKAIMVKPKDRQIEMIVDPVRAEKWGHRHRILNDLFPNLKELVVG